jgi:hypothetical protein
MTPTPHPAKRVNVLAQIEQIQRQFEAEWELDRKARQWPPQGSPLRKTPRWWHGLNFNRRTT